MSDDRFPEEIDGMRVFYLRPDNFEQLLDGAKRKGGGSPRSALTRDKFGRRCFQANGAEGRSCIIVERGAS